MCGGQGGARRNGNAGTADGGFAAPGYQELGADRQHHQRHDIQQDTR